MRRWPGRLGWTMTLVVLAATRAEAGLLYMDPLFGYAKTSDVVYGSGKTRSGTMQLKMDVYQPTNIGNGNAPANRPAIVIQDGGAWTSGSKTNGRVTTPAIYFAQRGYTVFIGDYRQVGDRAVSGAGPWQNLSFGFPVNIYPGGNVIRAGIEDFATAISYVRSNAATYGIDPSRIGGAGGSAGGINLLDLQYNNNPVPASYSVKAVIALLSTMFTDYTKVQAGGPPLFMLNSETDLLIPYRPNVEPNLHARLDSKGIYYEQWIHDLGFANHDIDYDFHPWLMQDTGHTNVGENVLERMRDFLATYLAGGAVPFPSLRAAAVPEPSSWALGVMGIAAFGVIAACRRKATDRAPR